MDLKARMDMLSGSNPFLSKTDIVYTLVLDEILAGTMRGGQKINQEELSAQLHISRSPVRDAFTRLSAEGYLLKEGASGYYIYNLRMEDYLDINEFRSMLEIYATELAVKNITSATLEALQKNIDQTAHAVQDKNLKAFIHLDVEFHKLLVQASQNPYIIQTYENCAQKFQLFRIMTLEEDMLPIAYRWHKMIHDAILAGDADGAAKAARLHRENTVSGALIMLKNRAAGS